MPRLIDSRVASIKPPASGQEEYPDDLVRGLRLRVGAGGRKAWIVRARSGAKVINKTLGSYPIMSLSAARDAAKDLLIELSRNGGAEKARYTFGELAKLWIEKVAKPNNRSWRLQGRRLEIYPLPVWRDRPVESITRREVRDLIDGIEGASAQNSVLTVIRTVFRYALSRDWIDASPAEAIDKNRSERSRDRVLDMSELKRIWQASDLLGFPFGAFIKLLMLTGQRRTEVAGMRWDDIDIGEATWTIPASANKSDRAHVVPLSTAAVQILSAAPRMGEYVWTNDGGQTHVKGYSKAKASLDRFIVAKGEPLPSWVLHDLRRAVATHMVRLGIAEATVGRVLNHAAQGVTAKVYALHSYMPEKRSALDRWAVELERAIAGRQTEKVVALHG